MRRGATLAEFVVVVLILLIIVASIVGIINYRAKFDQGDVIRLIGTKEPEMRVSAISSDGVVVVYVDKLGVAHNDTLPFVSLDSYELVPK